MILSLQGLFDTKTMKESQHREPYPRSEGMIALANSFRGQGPLKQEQTLPESLQNQLLKLEKTLSKCYNGFRKLDKRSLSHD